LYFSVAAGAVGVGNAIATTQTADRYVLGYVLYALIGIFWILVPGLLAYKLKRDVPCPTVFATIGNLERRFHRLASVVAIVIAAGLATLLIHLTFYPWPAIIPDLQDLHKQYQQHPTPQSPQMSSRPLTRRRCRSTSPGAASGGRRRRRRPARDFDVTTDRYDDQRSAGRNFGHSHGCD